MAASANETNTVSRGITRSIFRCMSYTYAAYNEVRQRPAARRPFHYRDGKAMPERPDQCDPGQSK